MSRRRALMSTGDVDRNGIASAAQLGAAVRRVNSPRSSSGRKRGPRRHHVTAEMAVLVRKVEAQRLQQMKMLARSGYRHIAKPALLVDLLGSAACHIRRNTSVDEVENKDRVPFLPLGRMNGRQDQIVLVELRAAGSGAAGIGRVQYHLGQKTLTGGVAGGDLLELVEVSGARRRVTVEAF